MRVACLIPWLVIGMVLPGQIPSLFGQGVATLIHDVSDMADGSVTQARLEAQRQAASGDLAYRSYKKGDPSSFSGKYAPPELPDDKKGRFVYGLALFSDDGCNMTVNGSLIHERMGQGQHLPNIGDSFHVLPTALAPGEPIDITVDYSNIIYDDDPDSPGYPDIDGCTLFLYLLPVELSDVKKTNDDNDDVVLETIPPKKSGESDNEYIQRPLSDKQIAYIEPHAPTNNTDPEMPHLAANLPGGPQGLKVRWKLLVEYKRGNGYRAPYVNDFTRPEDTVKIPASGEYTAEMDADQEWRIFETQDWQNQIAQNGFFGGAAKLYVWFPSQGAEPTEPFMTFRIGGRNPDQAKAKTFINSEAGSQFWYAYAIAKHETNGRVRENGQIRFYNQFYIDYKGGPIGDASVDMGWAAWAKGWPLYNLDRGRKKDGTRYQNGPGGYGMYQLTLGPKLPGTTVPTGGEDFIKRKEIWNWQDNVRGAINELQGKLSAAQSLYNGLQSTYSQWPSIPNEGHLSGLDAIVVTYYNGTEGLPARKVNGSSKRTPWTPEIQGSTRTWKFHQNSQDYVQSVDGQIE